MSVTTIKEFITPEAATNYLQVNTKNRPIRNGDVEKFANIIRKGMWKLTHQGVAFDYNNVLLDGQHRLFAIVEAGLGVDMLVTRGLDPEAMDCIDVGMKRTVADALMLNHGVKNSTSTAAAVNMIAKICCRGHRDIKVSTAHALRILEIYDVGIRDVFLAVNPFKPVRTAGVFGTLAFAFKTHPEEVMSFAKAITFGEGLQRGDPALTFRNALVSGGGARAFGPGGSAVMALADATLLALYHHCHGNKVSVIRKSDAGFRWFRDKQLGSVNKVRVLFERGQLTRTSNEKECFEKPAKGKGAAGNGVKAA